VNKQAEFIDKLDTQRIQPSDVIIVLRNHDPGETIARMQRGHELLAMGMGGMLLMSLDKHTLAEAECFYRTAKLCGWRSIILVTHKYHHYRAYLTFTNVFGNSVKVYSSPVYSLDSADEWRKIAKYAEKRDICTYEEGLEYLNED
jgi:hypothetical protein